jgi:hypothetical protein
MIMNGALKGEVESVSQIKLHLAHVEYSAVLCLNGMMPIEMERAYYAPIVVDLWPVTLAIVKNIRRTTGSSVYLQHLESVYELTASGALYTKDIDKIKGEFLDRLIERSRRAVEISADLERPLLC